MKNTSLQKNATAIQAMERYKKVLQYCFDAYEEDMEDEGAQFNHFFSSQDTENIQEQITDVEQRYEFSLPEDYKKFVLKYGTVTFRGSFTDYTSNGGITNTVLSPNSIAPFMEIWRKSEDYWSNEDITSLFPTNQDFEDFCKQSNERCFTFFTQDAVGWKYQIGYFDKHNDMKIGLWSGLSSSYNFIQEMKHAYTKFIDDEPFDTLLIDFIGETFDTFIEDFDDRILDFYDEKQKEDFYKAIKAL